MKGLAYTYHMFCKLKLKHDKRALGWYKHKNTPNSGECTVVLKK